MSQFLKVNSFAYHLDGGYINKSIDRFEVRISSTYEDCRDPEYKRKLLQLVLSKSELDDLIAGLLEIRDSEHSVAAVALESSDQ